jgi:hypothetical protein
VTKTNKSNERPWRERRRIATILLKGLKDYGERELETVLADKYEHIVKMRLPERQDSPAANAAVAASDAATAAANAVASASTGNFAITPPT